MIKKISMVLVALTLCVSLGACMAAPALQAATPLEVTPDQADPSAASYTDDLSGLSDYLFDCQVVAGEALEMSFEYIGAIAGEKFTYKYDGAQFTCEIYEFDLNNINDAAKGVIAEAKEKSSFTSLGKQVRAVMSDSGKFLMIPIGGSSTDAQKNLMTKLESNFKAFVGK